MSRSHYRRSPRRPRRGSHSDGNDACVVVRPQTEDHDVFFGVCENLGLWRIKAPPFDAHGAMDAVGGIEGFYEALAHAIVQVEADRPDLANWIRSLLDSRGA
jgi:hypothetical protein